MGVGFLATQFLAEARLVARIQHPNIVAVHAAGDAENHLFYVMDFHGSETQAQAGLARLKGGVEGRS